MEFGNYFKDARKQAGLTQKLCIHQSNVSDWENNISRPDYEKLIELAKIYEMTIEELLGIPELLGF